MFIVMNPPTSFSFPARGTFIRNFCEGTTKKAEYHDGNGGVYSEVVETNSTECGYVAPIVHPARGTFISSACEGTTKMGTYHDGNGGTYKEAIEYNSVECGYVAPPPPVEEPPPVVHPTRGTFISSTCEGTTKVGTYHDGSGGTYNEVIEYNSVDCGYVATPPPSGGGGGGGGTGDDPTQQQQ